ncbi:MmgE/PrpD family protein [Dactylosporangium sp. CA-139114]|uniref:MmgE/PrpD family protein n=1 Tax=Dactylosporangium sp. CA-139114 TaxID=3239931 RepID=UPI003D9594CD
MTSIKPEDLPAAVCDGAEKLPQSDKATEDAAMVLADVLGCAIVAARRQQQPQPPAGSHPVWGLPARSAPGDALMLNVLHAHLDDWDPVHYVSAGHPAAVLWPLATCLMETHGGDPADALQIYLVAHEVMCVLGARFGDSLAPTGRHATTLFGGLAAAAATAWWISRTPEAIDRAMSLAGTSLAGTLHGFGSDLKPFQVANAARVGWQAGQFAPSLSAEPASWLTALRELTAYRENPTWLGDHPQVFGAAPAAELLPSHIKHYPACAYFDQTLSQIERLRATATRGTRPVRIAVPAYIRHASRFPLPDTVPQARFSLPYLVAYAWLEGLSPAAFTQTEINRPDVRALARALAVGTVDGELSTFADTLSGALTVLGRDGRETDHELVFGGVRPDPSWSAITGKFAPFVPDASQIVDFCRALPSRSGHDWDVLQRNLARRSRVQVERKS